MTKVQKHFQLQQVLDDSMIGQLADATAIYGIDRIMIAPSRDALTVEFDATRLRAGDVEAALLRAGLPVAAVTN